ncbi:MAG: GNAT family N-acetyltransferase [Paracoccus sp. (in: a-proteobacteria)]|uniref:GNAT family N-acetyltransferase n=1 Tax=Paracoccus sp. TaxID=267 RepID=UPI0026DED02E|nr:GNAT family N-acetyltransferase [Paracoccus sp. (in: a-proteobacteria)]MDO5630593.1 GNAT family N-acetyltransferase [Paracoccus sp. (in: a-proteobacteria)]
MNITITDDLAACHALRRTVFIEEQNVSESDEMDDLDGAAIHLLATDDHGPVGTARLLIDGETGKIGRVCVLPRARGTGLGAALIRASMDHLRTIPGVTRAKLGAQTHALGFYEKLGFTAYGPIYDDAGIPHRDLARDL